MKKIIQQVFIFPLVTFLTVSLYAQEFRTYSGMYNNMTYPDYGASGALLPMVGTIGFADGISEPAGPDRPNPRFISNSLFMQNTLTDDVRGMSAYTWAWGQFIDHDITLSVNHQTETLDIQVPPFDAFFDPQGTGNVVIPMHRSAYDPSTGTGVTNPRRYENGISAFIDGSAVYGSDMGRAHWLRTFTGGKMKVSEGNLLPFNTATGEFDAPIDPDAPHMEMPIPFVEKWFVAGDVRANENPFLAAMHTIFVREHNRLCDELAVENPAWDDEMLFQEARKRVGGIMQAIVYEEWLPTMGLEVPAYQGYNSQIDPGILNVFSTAAYRYGHTTINSVLVRMDNDGNYMPQGDILLRDAYFNPNAIMDMNGIESYLIGMATVVQQEFDCKVIDDLRNFLFGPPGAGGLDLVALNINRGRDRGLPDYNTVRMDFGLEPVADFSGMSSDPLMNQALAFTYNQDIDNIDPWVGMLAENHMPDALFGKTAMTIIEKQFMALRDGDRFYYENDPDLTPEEKDWIKQTRLSDVIRRNSPVTIIQDEIFMAEPFLTPAREVALEETVSFSVYPNPATQFISLRVESLSSQSAEIRIIDMQGRTVMEKETYLVRGNNIVSITLPAACPSGLYAIGVHTEEGVGYRQLLVEQ